MNVCQFKKTNRKKIKPSTKKCLQSKDFFKNVFWKVEIAVVIEITLIFMAKTKGLKALQLLKRQKTKTIVVRKENISSKYLKREVRIDVYLPSKKINVSDHELLLINDGQDLPRMPVPFAVMLDRLIADKSIYPLICAGIYCGEDRMNEYGTANETDYEGRGAKATLYTQFIFEELLPFLYKKFKISAFKSKSFAGFSMGGLSALDIVWNYPNQFSKVGIFSGSLWWRSKSYEDGYDENTDRIMHRQIREGVYQPQLEFFIECGLLDEAQDRNNNGIIDSIDDAMDLIKELKKKGYKDDDIMYLELPDGKHDVPSWAKAFPSFLKWGWKK